MTIDGETRRRKINELSELDRRNMTLNPKVTNTLHTAHDTNETSKEKDSKSANEM